MSRHKLGEKPINIWERILPSWSIPNVFKVGGTRVKTRLFRYPAHSLYTKQFYCKSKPIVPMESGCAFGVKTRHVSTKNLKWEPQIPQKISTPVTLAFFIHLIRSRKIHGLRRHNYFSGLRQNGEISPETATAGWPPRLDACRQCSPLHCVSKKSMWLRLRR